MPAVGYRRESSEQAEVDQAYDYQGERLEAYGCTWVYGDRLSGRRDKRSGLEEALDKIRSGEADELVITHLFRLARSVVTISKIINLLKAHGAKLTILGSSINTSTPEGKAHLQFQSVIGELEAELAVERQRIGWQNSRKKARPRALIFGYRVEDGRYVPDRESGNWAIAQEIIAKAMELRSSNGVATWVLSKYGHMKSLGKGKYPPLTAVGIKLWLKNPILRGEVHFKGISPHLDQHEALIDAEAQAELTKVLTSPDPPRDRSQDRRYAYSSLCYCATCGGRAGVMRTYKTTPKRKKVIYYYRCNAARLKACDNTERTRIEVIEAEVQKAIAIRADAITAELLASDRPAPTNPKILELQSEIERLLPLANIDPRLAEIIADKERAIANLQQKPVIHSREKAEEAAAIMRSLCNPVFWGRLEPLKKRHYLQLVIKRILIRDHGVTAIEFLPWVAGAASAPAPPATGDQNPEAPE